MNQIKQAFAKGECISFFIKALMLASTLVIAQVSVAQSNITQVPNEELPNKIVPANTNQSQLAQEIESLKQAMINLNRDLFILEEDLLFPASTQVAVYLSMDIGEYFALDAVELKINNQMATQYLYTERQVDALYRGGVQRLYVGNLGQGEHELTAFFIGMGPEGREYKRAVSLNFSKTDEPLAIELGVVDSSSKQQPLFTAQTL